MWKMVHSNEEARCEQTIKLKQEIQQNDYATAFGAQMLKLLFDKAITKKELQTLAQSLFAVIEDQAESIDQLNCLLDTTLTDFKQQLAITQLYATALDTKVPPQK